MVLKTAERFYLTLEVDMDSMTVILIKDGKEGRTYDASQYFQYFVEYGVRKTDVVQLQEHFSIDYFQNMLITGKSDESFEFCVQFAGEDYKILQCKMKLLESSSSNIIRILLEDISHKRVQQLVYIKEHFEKRPHKPFVKPFDIKFEEQKDHNLKDLKKYKIIIGVTCLLCILLSAIFFQDIYSKKVDKAAEDAMNSCKSTNRFISQQLNCISHNLSAFKNLTSSMGTQMTKNKMMEYVEAEKREYGYEAIFFVDEKGNLLYTGNSVEPDNKTKLEEGADYSAKEGFFVTADYFSGSTLINYIVPATGLRLDGVPYKSIGTIFDINKICSASLINGASDKYDMVIIDKAGNILWSRQSETSFVNQENLFEYLSQTPRIIEPEYRPANLTATLEQKSSGTFTFMADGKKKFAAYMPLPIQDLYLVSLSKGGGLGTDGVRILILAVLMWAMFLTLPILLLFYQSRRIKEEKGLLEEIAYSDGVTGGMSMNYFDRKAKEIISKMECSYALVDTNLHNFGVYNENYGHIRGDELIRSVFLGISKYLDDDEIVCRNYAEHMMILMKYEGESQLEERLVRIGKCIIETNFKLECGVYVIRDITMDLNLAKERAGMALKNEINKEKNNVIISYYDVKLLEKILFEKKLENTMYRAFRNGEFKIYVEPRYDLRTRALCNGDAYAVWEHPEKGTLLPQQYTGVFERRGLIMCLDSFIYEEICKRFRKHLDKGRNCMPISITLHRNHFNVTDFIHKLQRIKDRYNVPGEYFSFEISEEILFEKKHLVEKIVRCIHDMGSDCIIGEYKERYLPLEALYKTGVDFVKFEPDILDKNRPPEMIDSILQMTRSIHAKSIVTGVSRQSEIAYLTKVSCDQAKGDAFAKDISLDEYIHIL
ncbi:EAL domain-containing protein [Aminipila luticellarii]|uniref:GGDEF domain-containing protein n=1 Tax=Aminipila luticellarii TaxID=2507160 RepID=A0A410PXH8_9FIRM|nr:EAL domain-containing protein [Aminipila luticellarii]QAT43594.1 GGDEF domain-containing protein [Aminipila luticellarii]